MIKVLIRKRLIMGEYNKSNEYGINPDCEYSALPEEINKPGNEYDNSTKEFNFSAEAEYNKSEDAKQQDFQSIGKKNQKSLRNIMKLGATAVAVFVLSTLMVNNGGDTLFGFSYTNDYINNGNVKNEISDNTYKPDDSSGKGKGTSEIPDADNANYTVKLVKVSDETYSGVTAVTENLLVASKNGKWGLIDGSGKVVKDFIYDSAGVFNYDFIGYVLVTNNSNGSTQQIFDSDNKLVYTRECEPNENIIGYTEGYVHILNNKENSQGLKGENTYVYIKDSRVVNEFKIYNSTSDCSDVINGYITPFYNTNQNVFYKVEDGNSIAMEIEINVEMSERILCESIILSDRMIVGVYKYPNYTNIVKGYIYNVKTKEAKEMIGGTISGGMLYSLYSEYEKSEYNITLTSLKGYIYRRYWVDKKSEMYVININDPLNKKKVDIDLVNKAYRIGDKEILHVRKNDKYGYVIDGDFDNVKFYSHNATLFSKNGYAIVSDDETYIIDTDFNVVSKIETGIYDYIKCNYFVKKDENNTCTLYRLEKIK